MTCYDWSIVGWDSHPIPGEPDTVLASASTFGATAEHITSAARGLQRLSTGGNQAKTLTAIMSNANEVAGSLLQAVDRYVVAAEALRTYGPVLAQAKAQAEAALQAAAAARAQHQQAQRNATSLAQGARAAQDPQQRDEFVAAFHRAKAQAEDAEAGFASARAKIEAAIKLRDGAANRAAQQVKMAITGKEINDRLQDRVEEVVGDLIELGKDLYQNFPLLKALVDLQLATIKLIWENMDIISGVLGILAILCAPFPPVALALGIAALVTGLISAGQTIADMPGEYAHAQETGDWWPFALSGVSVALSIIPGGRLAGRAIKVAKAARAAKNAPPVTPITDPSRLLPAGKPKSKTDQIIDAMKSGEGVETGAGVGSTVAERGYDMYDEHRVHRQECRAVPQ